MDGISNQPDWRKAVCAVLWAGAIALTPMSSSRALADAAHDELRRSEHDLAGSARPSDQTGDGLLPAPPPPDVARPGQSALGRDPAKMADILQFLKAYEHSPLALERLGDSMLLEHERGSPKGAQFLYLFAVREGKRFAVSKGEAAWGRDLPDLARQFSTLTQFMLDRGRRASARSFYVRALAFSERRFGPDHPETTSLRAQNELFKFVEDEVDAPALGPDLEPRP